MSGPKPIYRIDINHYPGLEAMKWLWDKAEIRFACHYLGPTDNHPDASWMAQRTDLAVAGWGFVPTYVGQQAHVRRSGVLVNRLSANDGPYPMVNFDDQATTGAGNDDVSGLYSLGSSTDKVDFVKAHTLKITSPGGASVAAAGGGQRWDDSKIKDIPLRMVLKRKAA